MKHLSYRRIIALAEDMNLITQEEKNHLEQCSLCREQIAVLSDIDEKLADISRVEQLINIEDVGELADKYLINTTNHAKNGASHRHILSFHFFLLFLQ